MLFATATLAFCSADALAGWITCARENEICRFDGRREVAFGAGDRWVTRYFENGTKCTGERFGRDPAPGVLKSCRVNEATAAPESGPAQWTPCAKEDGYCKFTGRHEVAYGARDKWVRKVFEGGAKCSTASFGTDPIPGVAKSCSVNSAPGAAATVDGSWSRCAGEGQVCRFAGSRRVAYGAQGKFSYRMASESIACSNQAFGDPQPGAKKSCYVAP